VAVLGWRPTVAVPHQFDIRSWKLVSKSGLDKRDLLRRERIIRVLTGVVLAFIPKASQVEVGKSAVHLDGRPPKRRFNLRLPRPSGRRRLYAYISVRFQSLPNLDPKTRAR
jgi:hypothetical protein